MKKLFLVFGLMTAFALFGKAQVEIEVAEAKFVYNFTKFFDWPQSKKSGDFVIGVLGANPVYYELANLTQGKMVGAQKIVVKNFKNPEEITDCHVLFVRAYSNDKISQAIKKVGNNTLIMSDSGNGIKNGVAIEFILTNDKLHYEFSKMNVAETGLKYHSKVEEMASRTY